MNGKEECRMKSNGTLLLDYKARIDMQSAWQHHIDASISSTVNLPNKATVEDVENLYLYAWENHLIDF